MTGRRASSLQDVSPATFVQAVLHGQLDGAIARLRPDGLILLSLYYLEALLIERRYRLPVVLLTPQYRFDLRIRAMEQIIARCFFAMDPALTTEVLAVLGGVSSRLRSFHDLARLLLSIPELVLLPKEFDLPQLADDPFVTYIGDGVDLARAEEPFPWDALDPRLPLVYCSLGSQADLAGDLARRFFRCVIEAAAARADLQFVLATGRGFTPSEFPVRPPNLYVSDWIPQLTVLARAGLMVNHAGVGTVKECILREVPMVVLPLMRDQFDCARRVVHHGLGVQGDLKQLTCGELLAHVAAVAGDPAYRQRVGAMRSCFLRASDARLGVHQVEAAVARGAALQPAAARSAS